MHKILEKIIAEFLFCSPNIKDGYDFPYLIEFRMNEHTKSLARIRLNCDRFHIRYDSCYYLTDYAEILWITLGPDDELEFQNWLRLLNA